MTYIKIGENHTYWKVKDGREMPPNVPDGVICDIADSGLRYKRVNGMWVQTPNVDEIKRIADRLEVLGAPVDKLWTWIVEQEGAQ